MAEPDPFKVQPSKMKPKPVGTRAGRHFAECWLIMYPDDPDVCCTCLDWSPE